MHDDMREQRIEQDSCSAPAACRQRSAGKTPVARARQAAASCCRGSAVRRKRQIALAQVPLMLPETKTAVMICGPVDACIPGETDVLRRSFVHVLSLAPANRALHAAGGPVLCKESQLRGRSGAKGRLRPAEKKSRYSRVQWTKDVLLRRSRPQLRKARRSPGRFR